MKGKLDDKSAPHVYMGYPATSEGYICLIPSTGRIIISIDVRFIEDDYLLNKLLSDDTSSMDLLTIDTQSMSIISPTNIEEYNILKEPDQSTNDSITERLSEELKENNLFPDIDDPVQGIDNPSIIIDNMDLSSTDIQNEIEGK